MCACPDVGPRFGGAAQAQGLAQTQPAPIQPDARALDQLGPAPARAGAAATPAKPAHPAIRHGRAVATGPHAHPNGPHQTPPSAALAEHATPAQPPAAAAISALPAAPPAAPVLPPPVVVPTRPVPLPPLPAVEPDAAGRAVRQGETLRVTFGVGSTALNPQDEKAVLALAEAPKPPQGSRFDVTGYALGTPDDPSTARRLSLSRALAVRSLLLHAGIASPDITVRALGAAPPDATAAPDRVDVALVPPPPAAAAPASTSPAPSAPANAKAATP